METPVDYRYTLANERTYLAWVRTGLALIAAGIAIRLFMADVGRTVPIMAAALGLSLLGGLVSLLAYRHWLSVQAAMERGEELPSQQIPLVLTVGLVLLALIVAVAAVS